MLDQILDFITGPAGISLLAVLLVLIPSPAHGIIKKLFIAIAEAFKKGPGAK